jgi:hypothetical protein
VRNGASDWPRHHRDPAASTPSTPIHKMPSNRVSAVRRPITAAPGASMPSSRSTSRSKVRNIASAYSPVSSPLVDHTPPIPDSPTLAAASAATNRSGCSRRTTS